MIFILIVSGSNHILEGVKSKDPAIPSLDDNDFAEKAYNYYKKVTCGSKGAKKASEIFKEINDATKEQQDEIRKKYNLFSIVWGYVFNELICVKKTLTIQEMGDMYGKHKTEKECEDGKRQLTAKHKVPKEIQDLNKKYLAFANKTYCS
jgi:hypothetical protein